MTQPALQDTFTLERMIFTDLSTIGDIRFDGDFFCYSLELSCRKGNSSGKLAIPAGTYEVTLGASSESELEKKVGYPLPLINNVPGRTGIRMHIANWPHELEGCVAPGMRKDLDCVYDSGTAMKRLLEEIKLRLKRGKLFISVIGGATSV